MISIALKELLIKYLVKFISHFLLEFYIFILLLYRV